MLTSKRLILAHFWLAFVVFGLALVLGAWQMFVRSPLNAWHFNPEFYYRSVTAHGSAMGYVFPTLVAMGFGYAITEAALEVQASGKAAPCPEIMHPLVAKGEEMGWFQHGSTIIVFVPDGFELCQNVRERSVIRVGQPLMQVP